MRRLVIGCGMALAGVAVAFGVRTWVADARAASATQASSRAREGVERARHSRAVTWATEELAAAEVLLRLGDLERARERARWLIPDYTEAVALWTEAEAAATVTLTLAEARHAAARDIAQRRLRVADDAVSAARNLPPGLQAGDNPQWLLARAHARLLEARIRFRDDDVVAAGVAAGEAADLARRLDDHVADVAARYDDVAQVEAWRRWKAEAIDWSRRERRAAVVVSKAEHQLTVYVDGRPVDEFTVDLGFNWIAAKRIAGDGATPEGHYSVLHVREGPATLYYKALYLDYPNAADRRAFGLARRAGEVPAGSGVGGSVEIHGLGGRGHDWTEGCVALSNADMDRLLQLVGAGARVTIIGADRAGALDALVTPTSGSLRAPAGVTR